ncbi:MAG: hypothetical protein OEW39_12900, partial [Deltaproteobacteria bacterium]|nr:hypothetical protein [Deltaproteobacteria bacterium]
MSDGSNAGLHRSQPEGAIRLRRLVDSLPRPIGLAGYGVEGRETLRCLLNNGVSPGDLRVFDRKMGGPEGFSAETDSTLTGVMWQGGEHWPALAACQTVVRSPGLRPDHPALAAAEKAGARMTSATRMFLAACPGPVAGVTGTLGKGTTVSLIGAALQASGIACHLGGNIGTNPLVFLPELEAHTVTVLELSS